MLLSKVVRNQIPGKPDSKAASLNDGELLMYNNESNKTVILVKLFYEESNGFSCWFN